MKLPVRLFLTLAFAVASAAPAGAASSALTTGPQVGDPAPAFSLTTLDGKKVSLESYRGKTLVINVWATWCPPCREEMPDFIKTVKSFGPNVAVLGVDTTEAAPIVRAYVAAKGVPYPQVIDGDNVFGAAYDIENFPTTYVIDPQGVIRVRYVDVIAPTQLKSFVADASAGRNGKIVSGLQKKIDATLAAAQIPDWTSANPAPSSAALDDSAKKAAAAIQKAEDLLNDSDPASGNPTDFISTRGQEAALRAQAMKALTTIGTAASDKALLPRLQGDAALNDEQWQAAIDAYQASLAIDPKNEDALGNLALAAQRLKKYDVAIDADTKLSALEPSDVGTLVDLARTQARAGNNDTSYATFEKALVVAKAAVDTTAGGDAKKHAKAVRLLAWAHLYFGRTYAKAGDNTHARPQFEQTVAWAEKLPAKDDRHDMYIEEGQEAIAALGLSAPSNGALVTLAPWTGADLPGSLASTLKYRLVVAGSAGSNVALRTVGLPKGWVSSFCTDRVCSPFKTKVAIPESGVKIVEFQLVPPTKTASAPKVRVIGTDGSHISTATT